MAEYRRSAHAVFDIKYHIVWLEKYRYKILRGRLAERARDLIRQTCEARGVTIVRGAVSPDHVHMLVSAQPELLAGEVGSRMNFLSCESASGGNNCGVMVDEETVKRYLENQKWDEEADGFKITARA